MNRYAIILDEWNRLVAEEIQLEKEYEGKQKGEIYLQKKLNITNKKEGQRLKAKTIGTIGSVCKISGKRDRPHLKNPRVLITERFTIYFVNVSVEEAQLLLPLHVKNIVHSKIEIFTPGKLMNTD